MLGARVQRDGVALHVRDAGPGIPEELRSGALERFTRGSATRDPDGGTGLGLAIVAAIAEAHGGRAGIADAPHSDVWIWVPG